MSVTAIPASDFSYAKIPVDGEIEISEAGAPLIQHFQHEENTRKRTGGWGLLVAVGLFLILFLFVFSVLWRSDSSPTPKTHHAYDAAHPPPCTFEECSIGGCDIDLAPYLCVDNYPNPMGCSATPWFENCAASCTMADCASTKPSDDTPTCADVLCPSTSCHQEGIPDYQICGDAAPYKCLSGSDAGGGSADPYTYALDPETTCGGCCDSTTC
mmetsp:Transcript_34822/g.75208  ORF Transcript_34822/g.75208 Transcript_34822/m.75208 type:complete len:213 (+) Transcript_34822:64-702(+)